MNDPEDSDSRLERLARISAPIFLLATIVGFVPALVALEKEPHLIDTLAMTAVLLLAAFSFFLMHLCIAVWLLLKATFKKARFSLQSLLVLNFALAVDLAILFHEAYRSITLLALGVVLVLAYVIVKLGR